MIPLNIEYEPASHEQKRIAERHLYNLSDSSGTKLGSLREKLNRNLYIIYALASSMCFGFGNYMVAYAMQKWRNNYTVLYPEGFSFMIFWVIYHLMEICGRVKKGEKAWTKNKSVYFSGIN